jgi:hypothetical protein
MLKSSYFYAAKIKQSQKVDFWVLFKLTHLGKKPNCWFFDFLVNSLSEAKPKAGSAASRQKKQKFLFLTRSSASRFKLRFAQPFS